MTHRYHGFDLCKMTVWQPWLVCIMASLFFFYEFILGNMFASIADDIMRDFHVQVDKMTYLSSAYYVSNVLFLFVAGIVLDRFSAKKTVLIAMLFCVLSTFVLAETDSFFVAILCRFIAGIGSAFCFLGPVRIASRWFPVQKMAFVTGVIVTIAMAGGVLAQYPLTKLVMYIGWRQALSAVGCFGALMLMLMLVGLKDKSEGKALRWHKVSIFDSAKAAYLNIQALRAALYACLMNMAVAVFGAVMGSLYLMQRLGVNQEDASIVNSMLFLGAIFGGPLMGWFSDRLRLRVLPMRLSAGISLLVVLSILYLPLTLQQMAILFFLLGFFTAAQVISYALVAESNSAAMTATAVSIVSILAQSGYIIFQNLFSTILLYSGEMHMLNRVPVYSLEAYQSAALILPVGLFVALLVTLRLKETHCQRVN